MILWFFQKKIISNTLQILFVLTFVITIFVIFLDEIVKDTGVFSNNITIYVYIKVYA